MAKRMRLLVPNKGARPIFGERKLGFAPRSGGFAPINGFCCADAQLCHCIEEEELRQIILIKRSPSKLKGEPTCFFAHPEKWYEEEIFHALRTVSLLVSSPPPASAAQKTQRPTSRHEVDADAKYHNITLPWISSYRMSNSTYILSSAKRHRKKKQRWDA